MIIIIAILIGVGSMAWRTAESKKLANPILWAILAPASYFIMQFIAGLIIGLTAPSILNDQGSLIAISLVTGVIGIITVFVIMNQIAAKKERTGLTDNGLLDGNDPFDEL